MHSRATLVHYTLLILPLQDFEYHLRVEQVAIDGVFNGEEEKIWEWVFLSKYRGFDKFIFQDVELSAECGGQFISAYVEILEVFGRVIRLSLVRPMRPLFITMLFAQSSSVLLFFGDMRRRQRHVIIHLEIRDIESVNNKTLHL